MSLAYLREAIPFQPSNAAEAHYDRMASQSGYCLAVIYQPFDPHKRGHFMDRAQTYDFALHANGGRILDFGPGDGWPSLLMAPFVREVVGVDGSLRRVEVCRENAARLQVANASFVHVPPGQPLPFPEASFDAVAAASSIEQTPDPRATLAELLRVLKPGGRLRMHYESLGCYRGQEQELSIGESGNVYASSPITGEDCTAFYYYDRHLAEGYVDNFYWRVALPYVEVQQLFVQHGQPMTAAGLTPAIIDALRPALCDAWCWRTLHPSGTTWLDWLAAAGFREATATYDGGWFAHRLFDRLAPSRLPNTLEETDQLLHPLVDVVVTMETDPTAPAGEFDRWITAVK